MLLEAVALLRVSGYHTLSQPDKARTLFEDPNIAGFVREYDTTEELLERWADDQAVFLRENASRLRADPLKA